MVLKRTLLALIPLALLAAGPALAAGDAAKGKQIYMANCIACHNLDPAKDGAIGPAIKGSSAKLLELRVLKTQYPAGYKPKRNTKLMVALPHLAASIPDLAAFLK